MNAVCSKCGAKTASDANFCTNCGAALGEGSSPAVTGAVTAPKFTLPLGIGSNEGFTLLAYLAGGLLIMLVSYNLLSEAFTFPIWEIIVASLAIVIILLRIYRAAGYRTLLQIGLYLSIYFAGGVAVLQMSASSQIGGGAWPSWQVWLIYTGLYAVLLLVLPALLRRWVTPPRDPARYQAIAAEAEEAHMRREAALTLLPSHSWYLLASWVTGVAMIGSFATTALGFYAEIVDPYAFWLIRFGVPIGLSAMAAFIIWSGWNFVFLRMRIAKHVWTRAFAFAIGFVILVPLTLAIHTVFGIIGVGGTEGLKAHYTWYANVLDRYRSRAEDLRQVELSFAPSLEQMGSRFKKLGDDETNPAARARCGTGQGDLWKYYSERSNQVDTIVRQISARKELNSNLSGAIEGLRKEIRDPKKPFTDAQEDIDEKFGAARAQILSLQGGSVMSSIQLFISQLAIVVEQETFFSTWSSCQARSKDQIKEEIGRFLTAARKDYNDAGRKMEAIRTAAAAQMPHELRIESFPLFNVVTSATAQTSPSRNQVASDDPTDADTIPVFVPMRPFWAVVSYANQLSGYIALQLALDFSPAILGFLFAVMAPLPTGPTRLGLVRDAIADDMARWWQRRRGTAEPQGFEQPMKNPAASQTVVPERKGATTDDPKILSVRERIGMDKKAFFDDLGRCERLLGDTLLPEAEISEMMKLAHDGVPQRLAAQPELLDQELLLHTGAARQAVILWASSLGIAVP